MSAVKRKQEKSSTKDRKEHKKAKTSEGRDSKKSAKRAPVKEVKEDSDIELEDAPEDEELEDEDEVEEESAAPKGAEGKVKSEEEIAKARLSRQEQKRQIAERKQAKPMGDVIQRSKRIWEQLRRKTAAPDERQKLIEELQTLATGRIKELVFKHDASRVVQTALKYGHKKVRAEIAAELKGTYVELAQSSYGKYLVVKVMHYGSAETRKAVVEEFCGHVKKLIRHREASFVIEDCFREFATREQKARLLREFYGLEFAVFTSNTDTDPSLAKILKASPEKRGVIMKNLLDILTAIVEKGAVFFSIVHKAMLEFISNTTAGTTEATEFLELVKEHVGEMAFTKDGAQVVMRCLALGSAKDRKVMLKSIKPVVGSMAVHESAHLVLVTAYDVVDDTVLVSKTFFPELQQQFADLAAHNYGRIPLLYPVVGRKGKLLQPSSIALLEEMDKIRESTSKKDPQVRQSELRTHLAPMLLQGISEHAEALVQDSFGCQLISEALLGVDGDKSTALEAIAELSSTGDPNDNTHFAASAAGGRMLKTLVTGGHYNNKEKKVEVIEPPLNFHQILYNKIQPQIKDWAIGPVSFVVVGLLEAEGFTQKDELKRNLNKNLKAIKAAAEGGNKGAGVIIKLIG
ncbi:armadillo-type protein [Geopyxis carbonaria]|nr:armadillo-type protein [Geopyxis carbonaria]